MFQSDGTSDETSEANSDGHMERSMGCGPIILGFWGSATNSVGIT